MWHDGKIIHKDASGSYLDSCIEAAKKADKEYAKKVTNPNELFNKL